MEGVARHWRKRVSLAATWSRALLARGIEVRAMVLSSHDVWKGSTGPPAWRSSGPTLRTSRDTSLAPSRVSTCCSTWRRSSQAGRTRNSREPWPVPSACWKPWPPALANGWCCAAPFQFTTIARSVGPYARTHRFTKRRTSMTAMAIRSPNGGKSGSPGVLPRSTDGILSCSGLDSSGDAIRATWPPWASSSGGTTWLSVR